MANKRTEEETRLILAENIKKFTEDPTHCEYSQTQLAEYLNISVKQLQRYKNGTSESPATIVYNLAEILNMDIRRLFMTELAATYYSLKNMK